MFKKILFIGLLSFPSGAYAQFGVCDRAANDSVFLINRDANNRIASIMNSTFPQEVKNAQITIIRYSHDEAVNSVNVSYQECNNGFRQPQSIVDTALNVYTFGINSRLGGAGHVDVSEIISGRPLGGPNAFIPQAREQILGGDNGTIANTIRDPVGCLTFSHSC